MSSGMTPFTAAAAAAAAAAGKVNVVEEIFGCFAFGFGKSTEHKFLLETNFMLRSVLLLALTATTFWRCWKLDNRRFVGGRGVGKPTGR